MSEGEKKIKKISVDRNLCISAGPCVFAADSVFVLDAERKAVLKQKGGKADSGPVEKEALEDSAVSDDVLIAAAQSCPVRAILLYDEDGAQINA